ncbi:MAG: DUF58 domain-containing protein [Clostridiales bacterium]|nr:DUF58 domain-containing protein [Clostridiales bacterium]MBQ8352274.1 DUF58 domain-containing protein [Clostridia bacterium]
MAKELAINEEFLQQLERLQMLVKNNVAGMFGGNRQSKSFGSSCEFADYRDYIAGDDVTKIDWNAFARFDKLYLKLYLDERQMHTRIYIDASRSMEYGDGKKALQAIRVAAAIAYLSVCEMDKVSIFAVKENKIEDVVVGMVGKDAYMHSILKLNEIEFSGDCCISEAILPSSVGYGDGMSVILSDFLTDNDFETVIDHLADKKRHVVCMQILSKEELLPQVRGKVHFFDSENADRFYRKNIDKEIITAYKKALAWATDRIRNYVGARGGDYLLVSAEESVTKIFFENLVEMGVLK